MESGNYARRGERKFERKNMRKNKMKKRKASEGGCLEWREKCGNKWGLSCAKLRKA